MPASFLKFRPFETSAEWSFVNPENGRKFTAPNRESLIQRITRYRADNQYPAIERLDLVLENYLCNLPCNVGKCRPSALKRGLLQYLKGGIALLSNLWIDKPVKQEEADRRSSICKDCKYNIFPDYGTFIKWSNEIALHSVGDKRSAHHDKLGLCEACTCPLRAKVFYAGPFDLSEEEKEKMASANVKCWQLEK